MFIMCSTRLPDNLPKRYAQSISAIGPVLILSPGVLTGGHGTRCVLFFRVASSNSYTMHRYVLANTTDLHSKLQEMSTHIRKLEDALRVSHAYHSSAPHPLLSDEMLEIKKGIDSPAAERRRERGRAVRGVSVGSRSPSRDARGGDSATLVDLSADYEPGEDDVLESFGTLTISDRGTERFVGPTGATEVSLPRRALL